MIYDICIIGAGVIGASLARELSQYDIRVLVLEKTNDVSNGATKANSGIIHGGYAAKHGTLKGYFSRRGNRMIAQLNKDLHFGYRETGSLVLAFSEDEHAVLLQEMENGRLNGVDDLQILYHDEIVKKEPRVSPSVYSALYCPSAGVCSPYEMTIALMENAVSNGVELRLKQDVQKIHKDDEVFFLETQDTSYKAKTVVNAAGVFSAKIAKMIGDDDFQIIPRKGQYLLFQKGYGSLAKHVLFQVPTKEGKGILVSPTFHENLILGPDAQEVTDFQDLDTDLETLKYIVRTGERSVPNIDVSKVIRSFSGIRATSSTGDFIIRASSVSGFFHLAGIDSPGLTSSPAIAQHARTMLQSYLAFKKKKHFHATRKAIVPEHFDLTGKEVARRVKLEKGDAQRVVCRCEQVTEAVIQDALGRGLPVLSTDAVKRRTRAGMGFCQGQFCRPRVAELLADYNGVNIDDVLTDQEGSGFLPKRVRGKELVDYIRKNEDGTNSVSS